MNQGVEVRFEPSSCARVLLIDEDLEHLELVARIIHGIGYNVQTCNSYAEGMHQLVSGAFDIIVVGQGSPKFEGSCILPCASEFNRRLPVVAVARHPEMSCYLEAMQLGAVDYLAGSLSGEEMARVMRTWAPSRKDGIEVERPTSGTITQKPVAA